MWHRSQTKRSTRWSLSWSRLRKLEQAQHRPRCVFQTGVDFSTLLPHAKAAQWVARLAILKTYRCLARGEVEVPLRDLEIVLRLARASEPRALISQLVATAITWNVAGQIIPNLLASPAFRDEHAPNSWTCSSGTRLLRSTAIRRAFGMSTSR